MSSTSEDRDEILEWVIDSTADIEKEEEREGWN